MCGVTAREIRVECNQSVPESGEAKTLHDITVRTTTSKWSRARPHPARSQRRKESSVKTMVKTMWVKTRRRRTAATATARASRSEFRGEY